MTYIGEKQKDRLGTQRAITILGVRELRVGELGVFSYIVDTKRKIRI
jgi:hypothetical protein